MSMIERIKTLYAELGPDNVTRERLAQVYGQQVVFIDPMHRIDGLDQLERYFVNLYRNLDDINFRYLSHWEKDGEAMLRWEMTYAHPKVASGRAISIPGVTYLQFDDRIQLHQDYFDSNQMLFDHLPVLGSILGWLKGRLNN